VLIVFLMWWRDHVGGRVFELHNLSDSLRTGLPAYEIDGQFMDNGIEQIQEELNCSLVHAFDR